VLERGLGLCRTWDIPIFFAGIAARLGLAYVLAGRTGEALPLLERAGEQATAPKLLIYPARAHSAALVSEAHLLAGRADGALAEHARKLARERKEPGNEAWVLRVLAEMAARRDPPDLEPAEASFRRALALAEELGMRPLQAQCHLGLGKLHRRIDRLDEARAELSAAAEMLREMGMIFWLPEAEAELGPLTAV
jgi:tetratricopeptide (TPR) repeat protein